LEQDRRGWQYILGARMRAQSEVRDEVLSRAGRYRVVHPKCAEVALQYKRLWMVEAWFRSCKWHLRLSFWRRLDQKPGVRVLSPRST